jgi:hypothetical protein
MEQTLTRDYHRQPAYTDASPAAQETIDVVFAAVARVTSPDRAVEVAADGRLKCAITWHDGAVYEVTLNPDGELLRLFRLQYTGGWEWDELEGRDVPSEEWRTVRAFTKDRAGKILGPALAGRPAAKSWAEASAR